MNDALAEIDYGDWTGRSLDDLRQLETWKHWNAFRSGTRVPGGEAMLGVQARAVGEMLRLAGEHPAACLALVSHGDVIKAALLYGLGLPIDAYGRFEVEPASISTLVVGEWGSKVLRLNEVVAA